MEIDEEDSNKLCKEEIEVGDTFNKIVSSFKFTIIIFYRN